VSTRSLSSPLTAGSSRASASVRNDIAHGTSFGTAKAVPFPVNRSAIVIAVLKRCATQNRKRIPVRLLRVLRSAAQGGLSLRFAIAWMTSGERFLKWVYTVFMPQPIKVDNSEPVTAYDTARTLGVSKKRTEQIIREVRRILYRDSKSGEFVVRAKRVGKKSSSSSHNGSSKIKNAHSSRKTSAARRKG
jgi:hypothetical protein